MEFEDAAEAIFLDSRNMSAVSERRGNNETGFKDFDLEFKAGIWP